MDMQQQEKLTRACSPSPHSTAMLASFKQFSLLVIPLLSHTSTLLWLRNSPRWCSAASPVSTLCLLALLKVLCLILASALSVLSVWPLAGRHNKLVHFPTYLVVEILGPGSWVPLPLSMEAERTSNYSTAAC